MVVPAFGLNSATMDDLQGPISMVSNRDTNVLNKNTAVDFEQLGQNVETMKQSMEATGNGSLLHDEINADKGQG